MVKCFIFFLPSECPKPFFCITYFNSHNKNNMFIIDIILQPKVNYLNILIYAPQVFFWVIFFTQLTSYYTSNFICPLFLAKHYISIFLYHCFYISVMLFPPFSSPIAAVDIFHCAFKSQLKIKLNQSSF